jgi:hypothetical protein
VSAEVEKVAEEDETRVENALLSAKASCAGEATASENLICDPIVIENTGCSTAC